MVGLFRYLFYRVYWWDNTVVKNNSYPVFSAVIGVTFFQVFNVKFINDFIFYIILQRKDLIVQQDKIIGIAIITIILGLNWIYFHKKASMLLEKIKQLKTNHKRILDITIIVYMILTIITTIGLAYMVRNNI
ncbi:hypothetical protein [Saccharicrinis sp. GN24d3]|uniref:hypothetical protein n=1 Tax=Saccharicrinis sp. GN24d3 TaxID=3458416 RepID=UPI0040364EEB